MVLLESFYRSPSLDALYMSCRGRMSYVLEECAQDTRWTPVAGASEIRHPSSVWRVGDGQRAPTQGGGVQEAMSRVELAPVLGQHALTTRHISQDS